MISINEILYFQETWTEKCYPGYAPSLSLFLFLSLSLTHTHTYIMAQLILSRGCSLSHIYIYLYMGLLKVNWHQFPIMIIWLLIYMHASVCNRPISVSERVIRPISVLLSRIQQRESKNYRQYWIFQSASLIRKKSVVTGSFLLHLPNACLMIKQLLLPWF